MDYTKLVFFAAIVCLLIWLLQNPRVKWKLSSLRRPPPRPISLSLVFISIRSVLSLYFCSSPAALLRVICSSISKFKSCQGIYSPRMRVCSFQPPNGSSEKFVLRYVYCLREMKCLTVNDETNFVDTAGRIQPRNYSCSVSLPSLARKEKQVAISQKWETK